MSEEELIETLRAFEKNRVEQLEEPAKNLFYAIMKIADERDRLNNIINELENRDDILEEYEDWLERQKTRNSEWDNFIMVDGRLGIPISYLLNKLQELKENNIEVGSEKE